MKNKSFGFGIIGTGAIAHVHAQALSTIAEAQLLGVFNRTAERASAFAANHGCLAFTTLEDFLADKNIDVVCICSASGAHLDAALACIEAGKHCLIEKPLEITTERCMRIIDAAEKKGVKIGTVFHSRFYPASQQLKNALDRDRFGTLVIGSAYVKWSREEAYYASAAWRGTWDLDGGGALMNQGIHAVDILQWYMGPVLSVQAKMANRRHTTIDVEDTVVANLTFANGALGSIECTTAAHPGTLKRIEIVGTKGTAVLEEERLTTWQFKHPEEVDNATLNTITPQSNGGASDPMQIAHTGHILQIKDFINAIIHHRPPQVDGREGLKSVAIIRAIYESARTDKTVFVK
ncbi:Gfo/Idh/MocA family protein [Sphingobacterium suaedae]|uniref:Gfo/Idh/MocA family protein n=1 Tax=Sphingobacterium suaedae TaxID=1686402 RepID=A0ABW5KEY6_9SPHI